MTTSVLDGTLNESERLRNLAYYSLQHDGFNPRGALELLAKIIEREAWKELGFDDLRPMLFASLDNGGLGLTEERARALIDPKKFAHPFEHRDAKIREEMTVMRIAVKRALTEASRNRGRPRKDGENKVDNINNTKGGTSETYLHRRLRRDRPDLAERVDRGELSTYAAAVEAGFRQPTASIPVGSPTVAVRALMKRFGPEVLIAAIEQEQRK